MDTKNSGSHPILPPDVKPVPTQAGDTQNRPNPQDSTVILIRYICGGDARASEILCARYLPILKKWAHGRLPKKVRSLSETDDLVQTTFMRTLRNVGELRLQHPGSFLTYLRNVLLNQIRDELRVSRVDPQERLAHIELEDLEVADLSNEIPYDDLEAYEKALAQLPKRQQELVVMRLEFGLSYQEIADEIGRNPDAARMMISRAIVAMSQMIRDSKKDTE